MTMFGINIPVKDIRTTHTVFDGEIDMALKRNEERKIFRKFLDSNTSFGKKIIDVMKELVDGEVGSLVERVEVSEQILVDFTISRLKTLTSEDLNVYDFLTRKIIENQKPEFTKLHSALDKGKFDGRLPLGYADASKNAQGILLAKIKDSLPKIKRSYFEQKLIGEKIREFSREMFYGINKLDLKDEALVNYLGILFELSLKKTAPTENEPLLKKQISKSVVTGIPIEVIYIKSLRYAYPGGKNMKIIDHIEDDQTTNLDGTKRYYYNEHLILERLQAFIDIFKHHGVLANTTILIADNDLEILFPKGGSFVPEKDVLEATVSAENYSQNLKLAANDVTNNVHLLTNFLQKNNLERKYQESVRHVYLDAKGPKRIVREADVEERVNYRFEFFGSIYGKNYTRGHARETMCNQIAHTMALSEVFKSFSATPLVVVDFRGNENKLIGGLDPDSRSIFLTKLKEPTIIEK